MKMNDELCSVQCNEILNLSNQIIDLLNADMIEEALVLDKKMSVLIKAFSESLEGYRSELLTDFCNKYIDLHEKIVSKIRDMQKVVLESLQNRHNSAKKICAYQKISRVGR